MAAEASGSVQHDIQSKCIFKGISKYFSHLGFPVTGRMGIAFRETGQNPVVFRFRNVVIFFNDFFQCLIFRATIRCDGDQLPGVTVNTVPIRIHHDIETANLIGTGCCLYNGNSVYLNGFFQQRMTVPPDDQVHTPAGIQDRCQLLVRLDADMSKQHSEINVFCLIGITDAPYFFRSFPDIHQRADQFFQLGLLQYFFCQDTDKQYLHPVNLQNPMGTEQAPAIVFHVQIGVDDRKVGTLFQKQKMGQPVIHFVIADGNHIRRQEIHDFNSRHTFEFRIDQRSLKHIPGNGVDHIFFFPAYLIYVTGQHGNTAHQLIIYFFYQKIAVQIVGMEQSKLF